MMKILVADDDLEQRDLYVDLFRSAGYEVIPASDGQEAWDKAQTESPNLVFTGIMMPRLTGFELIDNLRQNKFTATIPVVLFSHLGRPEDRKKAEAKWNVLFKIKGDDSPAEILQSVKEILEPSLYPRSTASHLGGAGDLDDDRPPVNIL